MLMKLARNALAQGQANQYQQVCHKLLTTAWSSPTRQRMRELVWTCALAPNSLTNPQQLVDLASDARGRNRTKGIYERPLAAALYRAGRFDEVIDRLLAALKVPEDDGRWAEFALLSMAYSQTGHPAEAADYFDKAAQASTVARSPVQTSNNSPRHTAVERQALLDEARRLLKTNPAAIE